jgi:hypothetical protein
MLAPVEDVAPNDVFRTLPSQDVIKTLAKTRPAIYNAHRRLDRAAWNEASVLPSSVNKFYRFGPPISYVSTLASLPYWWLYIADEAITCVYEAGFLGHDARRPGCFFLQDYPVEHGLIATMDFPTELRLLDLNGDVAFKMGIYDLLSSSDHLWCQWFAYQLQAEGLFDGSGRAFDGLLYPSRKNRGKEALALASTYVDEARPGIIHTEQPFKDTPEYRQLLGDPLRIAKP